MNAGYWVAVASASAAIVSALAAREALRTSRRHLAYRYLAELMREYAEPAMEAAIKELWDFFRQQDSDPEKLKVAFAQMLRDSSGRDLSSVRRRVSHFYQRMAALYDGDLLPKKVLYRIWYRENLSIIPKIIVPLEESLYMQLRGKQPKHQFDYLRRLYNDSPME